MNLSVDIDGNPRPIDVIGVGHEGDTAFDMGAYEYQIMKSDLNGDGKVDGSDLILFQNQWWTSSAGR